MTIESGKCGQSSSRGRGAILSRDREVSARAGRMSGALAFRVVAGLGAAALVAVLLERYSLASQPSPLLQPRRPWSPHPAPGARASNIFWGLQVTRGNPGIGGVQSWHQAVRRGPFPRGRDLRLCGPQTLNCGVCALACVWCVSDLSLGGFAP